MCEKKVSILLSTFNGEKYLKELLTSLKSQSYSNFNLVVRDDGSYDDTVNVLEQELDSQRDILIRGMNIGVVSSFFELIHSADGAADYIAFCDQDDVWLPTKLTSAISALEKAGDGPAMYCSRLTVVDRDLKTLLASPVPRRPIDFANALAESVVTGCTVVINRPTLELVQSHVPDPRRIFMHDWWLYLVVSAFGRVIFDSESHILYRQHGSNVAGMCGGWRRIAKKVNNLFTRQQMPHMSSQVREFLRVFGPMLSIEKSKDAEAFLRCAEGSNVCVRTWHFFKGRFYRQSLSENFFLFWTLLIGRGR